MSISLLPESAPFNPEQRAWLNGFFAGLISLQNGNVATLAAVQRLAPGGLTGTNGHAAVTETQPIEDEDFPWHDPALHINERLQLAADKPLDRQLMAAMAQLNCGACGYLCKTYSAAIASGSETNLKLCSPGGADTTKVIKRLLKEQPVTTAATSSGRIVNGAAKHVTGTAYSRSNPYQAKLVSVENLNGEDSAKHTSHVVIDLRGSGLTYEVGDSLGVVPRNCPEFVRQVIEILGSCAEAPVALANGSQATLFELLTSSNLRDVDERCVTLLEDFATSNQLPRLRGLLDDEDRLAGMDLLDLLEICRGAPVEVERFATILTPLSPRLYSIASSQRAHPDQVHLTVGKATCVVNKRLRKGVASSMFSDRLAPGDTFGVFVQPSHGFRLPADPKTPIIMVGPGTGVAPFRAFLQERRAAGAKGEAWLFFGDQRSTTDFLYADEWNSYLRDGSLTRLDTAFSRDQAEKIYVQHRMLENGAVLYRWLEAGAYFYICGDAKRMASDVHRALHDVVAKFGGKSDGEAKAYVNGLASKKRYLRDVY